MKNKTFKMRPISLALLLAGIGMAPASYAVDLMAVEGSWTPAGGTPITMWGFATDTGSCATAPTVWGVGPQLSGTDLNTGNLTINLRNCLSEGVSIVIPGQPASFAPVRNLNGRVTAFTTEAAANGGLQSYTWNGVKSGTYLYQSGSHPAKQVQMGLYGALTVGTYAGVHDEATLLYSEIDPALHDPIPKAATPLGYNPRHFLVNGATSQSGIAGGDTNHPTLLRMLNAGLDFHVPTLVNGGYMTLVAEDGNLYPFAKQQYSVNLAAGKTIDALWQADADGDYVIYDRRGNNMVASLTVAAGAGQPIAIDDTYPPVAEDGVLNVVASGILANDTDASGTPLVGATASLVSSTSSGNLTFGGDGSFTYTPNADFNGTDTFTYRANDVALALDSNVATVNITVAPGNDAPVANAGGPYTATVSVPVTLDGTGSSDIDVGDNLTYAWDFDTDNPGVSTGTGATPSHTYTAIGTYNVSLIVNDGTVDSVAATTTIEVGVAVNAAPVAVGDTFEVLRNSAANNLDLTDNDSDVDGNLKNILTDEVTPAQITITTGSTTTRGGTVNVITNGVNYVPKRNFRGTDTFNYIVSDLDGAPSNEVTVRVNVVRP